MQTRQPKPPKSLDAMSAAWIGQLVGVSEKTVSNWISSGHLKAWTIQGRGKRLIRRVSANELYAFCKRKGIPVPDQIRSVMIERGYVN